MPALPEVARYELLVKEISLLQPRMEDGIVAFLYDADRENPGSSIGQGTCSTR